MALLGGDASRFAGAGRASPPVPCVARAAPAARGRRWRAWGPSRVACGGVVGFVFAVGQWGGADVLGRVLTGVRRFCTRLRRGAE